MWCHMPKYVYTKFTCNISEIAFYLRFVVRDFVYNEEELAAGKNEITKLEHDKKKQYVRFLEQLFKKWRLFWFLKNIYIYL